MKKLISFKQLKNVDITCMTCTQKWCIAKNCPVWKKLETSWTMAVLCRKCVHSSPDDQICDHTGWDKRTLKECPYMQLVKNV
jgi:hypothetical protein